MKAAIALIKPLFLSRLGILALLTLSGLLAPSRALAVGTWVPLANPAPDNVVEMALLTDGTVMANAYGGTAWYRLTPDTNGSYLNGTWTTLASMAHVHIYSCGQVLRDGRFLIGGAEYGDGGPYADIYQPTNNTWTRLPNPGTAFPDNPGVNTYAVSGLLPNGNAPSVSYGYPQVNPNADRCGGGKDYGYS